MKIKLTTFTTKFNSYPLAVQLGSIATLSALIYLILFTLPFPLHQLYSTIPPVDYAKLTHYSPSGFLVYFLGICTLFGLYMWAIRLCAPPTNAPLTPVIWGSISYTVILIFSYPLTAIDLFIYAIRSRGWALYGLSPLATPPELLPTADPWLGLAGEWVDAPSPYGPLWEILSLGGFYASNGWFLGQLFVLKISAGLAYLGCVWLVYKILIDLRPTWAVVGTLAFAWNPLALFESVQNAHNDIVMVFFFLAALWFFSRSIKSQVPLWAALFCFFFALSILVKFVTSLVLPFFLLALALQQTTWLSRLGALLGYGVLIVGLVVGAMWFVWPGWETWAVLIAGSGAGRSVLALAVLYLRTTQLTASTFATSRNVILGGYALIYLYFLGTASAKLLNISQPNRISVFIERPLTAAFYALFWYVLLAAPVFHAWYLLWFLPLVPLLLPQQQPLSAAIVFSVTALLVIPYFETIRVWYPVLIQNHLQGHLIGVPLLIIPPMVALLWPISLTPASEV